MDDGREGQGRTRAWRVAGRAAVVAASVVASTELLAAAGRHPAVSIAAAVGMTAVPAAALLAAIRAWPAWTRLLSFVTWLAAGAAVLVATSVPPLSRVEGMQSGGLAAVATVLLVVPVVRGGYNPRRLADVRAFGPVVDRIESDR